MRRARGGPETTAISLTWFRVVASLDRLAAVERRVRHTHLGCRHGDTDEVVAVEVEEALTGVHGCLEVAATLACSTGKRAAPAPRARSPGLEILRMGILAARIASPWPSATPRRGP